jgi:hypothetical protein
MSIFETILQDLIVAGSIIGPIFIHSAHGVAILNASEEAVTAIVQANNTQTVQAAASSAGISAVKAA